jgi:ParB family transcriptional regulator, chromosome partitioning protein
METTVINGAEYRNVSLSLLTESKTNPRRIFEDAALKELAESIHTQGVLSPLLVRPLDERSFEIVAGARRFRAAQMAEAETVPVRIVNLTDAEALEAQLVENLMRRDVHPLEEAQGFRALLNLDEPKYSIEQISAKTGKNPAYVAARLKLTELAPAVVEAFSKDEIGVGHALLLAKLQPAQQEQALAACYQEAYGNGSKSKRILLPVRHLQQWIEQNVMLVLKDAPFDCKDAQVVPAAGSCLDCSKRTGHNKLLFAGVVSSNADACSDPACYSAKLDMHVKQTIVAKPRLVQITTVYGKPAEGSAIVPRNKYVEIRQEKPQSKYPREAPEYRMCKYATEAIIADGTDKGEFRKVCANPDCPVHHPEKQQRWVDADAATKAAQEKQRREEAIANTTGIRVLGAIAEAVPVRLMKRDLLFIVERLAALVDERRLEIVARQHSIKREKDSDSIAKLFAVYLRRQEESVLGSVLVELAILLTAVRQQMTQALNDAAVLYEVDTDVIAAKVKQEFAAKDKAKTAKKAAPKPPAKQQAKTAKKSAAA